MEKKKDPRGRKPEKDKKMCIRLYVRQSKVKKAGGEKQLTKSLYEHIDTHIVPITNY